MSKTKGVSEARAEYVVDDDDVPELTPERAARLKPAREILPESVLAQFKRSPGRPKLDSPKKQVTLRLDADVLEYWRAQGRGWQSRLNDALRRESGLTR
ncbi:BrnA antitoxin family protein [Brevundimonas sp.]|uniref:BrnA antitoxin family protein n=1 Tax=Brevundimonas sp. TaxID=1871086 RepID=UPI003F6F709A